MNWVSSDFTDTGKIRNINEDSVLSIDTQNMWAVADGMGGHESGDFASQLVVEKLANFKANSKSAVSLSRIVNILSQCNLDLLSKAANDNTDVIGCTVAALTIHNKQAMCTWCGDSRIYRIRQGDLLQLTRDHSCLCASEDRDIIRFPDVFAQHDESLTAAIGGDQMLQLEHCTYGLQPDDIYILCTDGLYKEVSDIELLDIVRNADSNQNTVQSLYNLYFNRGARDNVGIVLVSSERTNRKP